ncbi:MAG: DUF4386 family protein [Ekhidna sp.]|nr:DUF4386 family protein [Ekhidna sp.]
MNTQLLKTSGISALSAGAIYVIGFVVLFTGMAPLMDESSSTVTKLSFLLDNRLLFQSWILLIYVIFGVILVFIVRGISYLTTLWLSSTSAIFGYIWSGLVIASGMVAIVGLDASATLFEQDPQQAADFWVVIDTIHNALGGGVEVVGGVWMLIISAALLKSNQLSKAINWLGIIVGLAGIISMVPGLSDAGAVFGLLQIVWFIWLGILMLARIKK